MGRKPIARVRDTILNVMSLLLVAVVQAIGEPAHDTHAKESQAEVQ